MADRLSPAAQAVLDAAYKRMDDNPHNEVEATLAAAIRALVEQTVPADSLFCSIGRFNADLALEVVRNKQLAIAAELEGAND
jgi:hypothetical protein